ncbi:MAG: molybdopterin-dependent oxidoreductase, partial [Acidimicrobiia bacterium]
FAVASAGVGRALLSRAKIAAAGRDEVVLPLARATVSDPSPAASFNVSGLSPIVTSNEEFYRIDTALTPPRIDLEGWSMSITGMVDRPLELTYEHLLDMPMIERYVTLCCVSNEVGGNLISNAKWLGVPLEDLLVRAGVHDGATQIVGRSVDKFTVGFPTETALDGREALVAVGMNGEPLPFEHGFPARIVVSGLYGYVSATKWLSEIELTTWEAFDAYWIPRGWSKEGPVKTQSRIDLPRSGARLNPGLNQIAGVAWAQNRGITKVEVRTGDDAWREAQVSEPLSKDTWVQWAIDWDAPPGSHLVSVRATDATGITQGATPRPPRPDGAEGYHSISVAVSA